LYISYILVYEKLNGFIFLMNSKRIGNISEANVLAKFVELEIPVLLPFGDDERYDMVINLNNMFYKIQVKTGTYKNGYIIINTCSTYGHRGKKRKYYTKDDIDFIVGYCSFNKKCYLLTNFKSSSIVLRLSPTKNNQKKGVNFAIDYELEKKIKDI